MTAEACPVWLYRITAPPEGLGHLLLSLGFRRALKSGVWWRIYDLRLPGIPDRALKIEALVSQYGLSLRKTRVRRNRAQRVTPRSVKRWSQRRQMKHVGAGKSSRD